MFSPFPHRVSPVFLLYTKNLGADIVGFLGSFISVVGGSVGFGFVPGVGILGISYSETFTFDIGVSPSPYLPSYLSSLPTLPSTHTLPPIFIVKSTSFWFLLGSSPGFVGKVILFLCNSRW